MSPLFCCSGNRFGRKGKPGSTAAADNDATASVSFAAPAAAAAAAAGAAAAGNVGDAAALQEVSQDPSSKPAGVVAPAGGGGRGGRGGRRGGGAAGGRGGRGGGRKRKLPAVWGSGGVGVPADILMEAVQGPHHLHTAGAGTAQQAEAAAAGGATAEGAAAPDQQHMGTAAAPAGAPAGLLPTAVPAAMAQQQQQQDAKRARPSRSAAAGVAAATIAAGGGLGNDAPAEAAPEASGGGGRVAAADAEWDPAMAEADNKALQRSANCKAAVARRWARYREEKARALEMQQLQAAGAMTQLPQLGGRELVDDITTINSALLFVSDSMSLPGELLQGLAKRMVQALQTAAAAAAAAPADKGQGEGPAAAVGAGAHEMHAAVRDWYQRLCAAVTERNGSMVAQLFEELGAKVLAVTA